MLNTRDNKCFNIMNPISCNPSYMIYSGAGGYLCCPQVVKILRPT